MSLRKSKSDIALIVVFSIAVVAFLVWIFNGERLSFDDEYNCLNRWHAHAIDENIGHVNDWLALERCEKHHKRYKELYDKYGLPKVKESE